ncbi:MAG: SDR family oxidoreductase [Spongiibacteraceae bacterium]|nr:SDR family oxidoreductase [Spongiibacteraceae bacterium]
MAQSHQGRVAILTGGAGGLGRFFARSLAAAGCDIAIADLAPANEVVEEIEAMGQRAYSEVCDLADENQIRHFANNVQTTFGRCDILINNAAYMPLIDFKDLSIAQFRKFEAVNVEASLILAQCVTPGMVERGYGRIVQITSSTVGSPMPGFLSYVTSKMAGIGLVRALAAEFGDKGVLVNGLSPGLTRTPESEKNLPPELFDAVREKQIIKKTQEPEDLCGALLFLTSENCGFVTGQNLNVDGGHLF